MAKITGADQHLAHLRRMRSPSAKAAIYRGLFAGAGMIEAEARHSITESSISGKGHVPSDPGEPPNADTHQLDTSIHIEGDKADLMVKVVADAPHALAMEFGASEAGKSKNVTIAERPYMRPARKKVGSKAAEFVNKYLSQLFRRQ